MKKVAIVGTQGVPAQYGGFETLVENIIGDHRSGDVEYTVFCSGKDYETRRETYKGATTASSAHGAHRECIIRFEEIAA